MLVKWHISTCYFGKDCKQFRKKKHWIRLGDPAEKSVFRRVSILNGHKMIVCKNQSGIKICRCPIQNDCSGTGLLMDIDAFRISSLCTFCSQQVMTVKCHGWVSFPVERKTTTHVIHLFRHKFNILGNCLLTLFWSYIFLIEIDLYNYF